MEYREFTIRKSRGKVRKLVAPDAELLTYQQKNLRKLHKFYMASVIGTDIENVAHGFIKGRNVVTAAQQHVGFKTTLQMDMINFFDTVFIDMLPKKFQDKHFYHKDGYCGQGFATSPMLSNIASIDMLKELKAYLSANYKEHALTIYADDIQISVNTTDKKKLASIVKEATIIVEKHRFIINPVKTRFKYAKFGFRRILGVNVGDTKVRATRKIMRKIRAARHQSNKQSLGGLVNWSKCALPTSKFRYKPKPGDNPCVDIFMDVRGTNPYTYTYTATNDTTATTAKLR